MLLFFIIILGVIIIASQSEALSKQNARNTEYNKTVTAKTNATLERALYDAYLKTGFNSSEAYRLSQLDLGELGFASCVPRDSYKNENVYACSECKKEKVYYYDSGYVQKMREAVIRQWEETFNKKHEITERDIQRLMYRGSIITAMNDLGYNDLPEARKLYGIGDIVFYPGLGDCEVVNIEKDTNAKPTNYVFKILESQKLIYSIQVYDKAIVLKQKK